MSKNIFNKRIILLQSVLLLILAVSIYGCSETNQNNTFSTPEPGRQQINKFITPQEAYTLMQANKNNPNFIIIDDRSPADFRSGRIANAINIPTNNFSADVSRLDKNKIYLVYCPSGCGATSRTMKSLGFKEVYEIEGGLNAWKSKGLPVVK